MARRHVKQLDLNGPAWGVVAEALDPLDDPAFVPKGMKQMLCSIDERTGAQTRLVMAEAGWKDDSVYYHHFLEEFYVLSGRIRIGDNVFTEGSYYYMGHTDPHGPFEALEDTIAIKYVDAPVHTWTPGSGKTRIDHLDVGEMPWEKFDIQVTPGGLENVPGGAWYKLLNVDEATGARTFYVKFDAGYEEPFPHYHYWAEEVVVTKGTLDMHEFMWPTMFYAYRPPGILHCPLKIPEESELLIRADAWEDLGSWRFDNFHLHRDSPYGFDRIAESPVWSKRYR